MSSATTPSVHSPGCRVTLDRLLAEAVVAADAVGDGVLAQRLRRLRMGQTSEPAGLGAHLTGRERDVLALLAEGRTNRQIAERLNLSAGTVRNYASSAFAKLGVRRRSEAAVWALRLGLAGT